jgi:hypothetical protein
VRSTAAKGTTAKHAGTGKTAGTRKHAPGRHPTPAKKASNRQTGVAKHATHAKARALAIGDEWDCCCAEALGASLRLAGWPVADDDVLALHVAAGGSQDRGVSILAALEAASVHGLAGVRPVWFGETPDGDRLILGLELPGPHAVLAETGRWWSWGQPWPPAAFHRAVVEEAWAVVWP